MDIGSLKRGSRYNLSNIHMSGLVEENVVQIEFRRKKLVVACVALVVYFELYSTNSFCPPHYFEEV